MRHPPVMRHLPTVALLFLACGTPAARAPAPPPRVPPPAASSPTTGTPLAITVDDLPFTGGTGPGDTATEATRRMLGHLAARDAPATGFVVCDHLADHPGAVIGAWRAAGQPLGNHSSSHTAIDEVTPEAWRADVARCQDRLAGLLGAAPRWFRYPYLRTGRDPTRRDRGREDLAALDLSVAQVTIDTADWALAGPYVAALRADDRTLAEEIGAAYVAHVRDAAGRYRTLARRRLGRDPGHVLLLHANALAADHLGAVLDALRTDGFRLAPLDAVMADPVFAEDDRYAGELGVSWLYRLDPETEARWRWDRAQIAAFRIRFADREARERIAIDADLTWRRLVPGAWVVTHRGIFEAHSVVAEMADGTLVLADTPPTEDATRRLLEWLRARFGPRPLVAVDGHFHLDASGGNAAVIEAGGRVVGADLTAALLRERGAGGRDALAEMARDAGDDDLAARFQETTVRPPTETFPLAEGVILRFGDETAVVVHPGHAHSPDNVAVHFPDKGVLFGGCMVIGMDRIGYTGDANLETWPAAMRRLQTLDATWVVPGHGHRFRPDVLAHTLRLLEERRRRDQ